MLRHLRHAMLCALVVAAGSSCVRSINTVQTDGAGPTSDGPTIVEDLRGGEAVVPPADTGLHDSSATADGPRDSTPDAPTPWDGAVDQQAPPPDHSPPPDAAPTDSASDQGTVDGPAMDHDIVDAPPASVACANGSTIRQVYSGAMVACGGNGKLNQCQAASLCGPSWHLCLASEFIQRGGATQGASVPGWIAGCVRDGPSVTAPMDGICSGCSLSSSVQVDVSWACGSAPTGATKMSGTPLGLHSFKDCYSVGLFGAATSAYWQVNGTQAGYTSAVCCQ